MSGSFVNMMVDVVQTYGILAITIIVTTHLMRPIDA
jgi:hypothetical protein